MTPDQLPPRSRERYGLIVRAAGRDPEGRLLSGITLAFGHWVRVTVHAQHTPDVLLLSPAFFRCGC